MPKSYVKFCAKAETALLRFGDLSGVSVVFDIRSSTSASAVLALHNLGLRALLSARRSRVIHHGTRLRSSISLPLRAHRQNGFSSVGSAGVALTHALCQSLVGTSNGQKYAVKGWATRYFACFNSVITMVHNWRQGESPKHERDQDKRQWPA